MKIQLGRLSFANDVTGVFLSCSVKPVSYSVVVINKRQFQTKCVLWDIISYIFLLQVIIKDKVLELLLYFTKHEDEEVKTKAIIGLGKHTFFDTDLILICIDFIFNVQKCCVSSDWRCWIWCNWTIDNKTWKAVFALN